MAREIEQVRRALRTAAIRLPEVFAPGARLVVGFSGGQDSACLLHALARSHRKLDLIAAHVDHALKADSAEAAQRAVELAHTMGVPQCEVVRVDVTAYRARLGRASIQQAARAARYDALAGVVDRHNAQALIVAHTADDQAETLLMHLIRGSGLTGLQGMRLDQTMDISQMGPQLPAEPRETSRLRVVRPLLGITRRTTLAYCSHFGLPLVDDHSNQTRIYTRNRVRLDVLPALEQFNPGIRSTLARTAELAAEDSAALDVLVANLQQTICPTGSYDLATWRAQPRALQRRLLRLGLASLVGGLADVNQAPIEDALDLLQTAQPNQTYHLPYGVELCIGSRTFSLRMDGRARPRERRNK